MAGRFDQRRPIWPRALSRMSSATKTETPPADPSDSQKAVDSREQKKEAKMNYELRQELLIQNIRTCLAEYPNLSFTQVYLGQIKGWMRCECSMPRLLPCHLLREHLHYHAWIFSICKNNMWWNVCCVRRLLIVLKITSRCPLVAASARCAYLPDEDW